jgi:hypothetical protein
LPETPARPQWQGGGFRIGEDELVAGFEHMDEITTRLRGELGREPSFDEVRAIFNGQSREWRREQEQRVIDEGTKAGAHPYLRRTAEDIQRSRDSGRYTTSG